MPIRNPGLLKFSFSAPFVRCITWCINKINFTRLVERIAQSQSARPFFEQFSNLPQSWQNAEKTRRLAAELTHEQLVKNGEKNISMDEITPLIRQIEIQYERDLHIKTATALGLILDQLFEHQNPDLPFVSSNKRDIAHIEKLRQYRKKGLGVVYLINHSSHLDEFLVDLLFQHLELGLPVFAAGQNMMAIKSIARLLMVGSYVVLRQGADHRQMAALYNYCKAVSRCGEQQGIFLEAWRGGARSRDGSLRYPKRLVTLRGAIDVDTDLVIQPVSISFSAVPEDLPLCARKSPISWLRGLGILKTLLKIPFAPRTFLWKSAKNLYGRACISMPEPFLLNDLKKSHKKNKSGVHLDEFVALSCIKSIACSKKIMASQITATGLMAARKSGPSAPSLELAVEKQIEKAKAYHHATFGCSPDFEDFVLRHSLPDIVKDGLAMLRKRGVVARWRKDRSGLPIVKNNAALSFYATHADRRLYSPTADQNIVVMGAGNWGFALACLIGERILDDKKYNNASLTIFDPRVEIAEFMGLNRNGPGHFEHTLLPKNVFVTSDFEAAFRKASDVIIALKPDDFEKNFQKAITTARQSMKIMIATRGFLPQSHMPSYLTAMDLVQKSGRKDISLFTLSGPVDPDTLVETQNIRGILAGPAQGMDELMDLFDRSFVQAYISRDPVGVQTADILARIYALWISFLQSSDRIRRDIETGYLMAQCAEEACALSIHLGGSNETFSAASIPWTATFNALCLSGLWADFGRKLGKSARKGKPVDKIFEKFKEQYETEGIKIQALDDIQRVLACAEKYNLRMPVMQKINKTFYKPGG